MPQNKAHSQNKHTTTGHNKGEHSPVQAITVLGLHAQTTPSLNLSPDHCGVQ